ncbi:hypothetical protein BGZ72_008049 [Mortierella alpina]|nr:hypothetical protein BGZ72_008049 [Mortierella alpina]
METLWTSKVLGALYDSEYVEDNEAFLRLSRQTSSRRLKRKLRPIESRQEVVVAEEQETRLRRLPI